MRTSCKRSLRATKPATMPKVPFTFCSLPTRNLAVRTSPSLSIRITEKLLLSKIYLKVSLVK
jgi:hypothetical protein